MTAAGGRGGPGSVDGPGDDPEDERLLTRLRQLGLIELDALLFGAGPDARARLVAAYADDLADALSVARARMAGLLGVLSAGPDPLGLVAAGPEVRAGGGALEAAGRLAQALSRRAEACRTLARLDEACAVLLPRLFAVERMRRSSSS
jgi:hypothetical protein